MVQGNFFGKGLWQEQGSASALFMEPKSIRILIWSSAYETGRRKWWVHPSKKDDVFTIDLPRDLPDSHDLHQCKCIHRIHPSCHLHSIRSSCHPLHSNHPSCHHSSIHRTSCRRNSIHPTSCHHSSHPFYRSIHLRRGVGVLGCWFPLLGCCWFLRKACGNHRSILPYPFLLLYPCRNSSSLTFCHPWIHPFLYRNSSIRISCLPFLCLCPSCLFLYPSCLCPFLYLLCPFLPWIQPCRVPWCPYCLPYPCWGIS
mmetsp:Transcript_37586/g.77992  ORF Transcript_37586/g.77992 Transcript_37586/m.77992 type:complete len:255 (-) Transcript_37586:718-1482(-)